MKNIKISVIVPIFNAESYLRKCLESIRMQTHSNLEIILVDDGSTDGSCSICREYVALDDRFHLIVQENRGVSAARNAGLNAATGQWVGWADPDDYIDPDIFSYLLSHGLESQADICICGWYQERGDSITRHGWSNYQLLDTHQAIEALLRDDAMPSFLWNKLWKRDLLLDLQFPNGIIYEDVFFCWRAFLRAQCILCLPEAKYHYVRYPKSLSGEWSVPKLLDFYLAVRDRYDGLIDHFPQHRTLLERDCIRLAFLIGELCFSSEAKVRKEHRKILREMAAFALSRKDKQNGNNRVTMLLRLYAADSDAAFFLGECLIKIYSNTFQRK